jgi:hypothetical protein
MFPPGRTPLIDTIDMKAVLRQALIFLVSVIASFGVFIALFLTALVVTILVLYRHRIHHIHWRLLKLLYKLALDIFFGRDPPMEYVVTILVFGVLGFIWLLLLRWAWNRRADRLNREASLPKPAVDVAPGVWPPPPNVSRGR